jgi:glycosyltransferase involved in cell wall biosynthesis
LNRTIASVLEQTLADFELILVDDGSTDDSVDRALSIHDPRLSILRQSNQGPPAALNRGLAAARGEYIALLDSDDFWAPTKLERHLESFRAHSKADLTFTGLIYVNEEDEPLKLPRREPTGSFTFEQLYVDYAVGTSSAIAVRSDAIRTAGGFDPAMVYMFDVDLVLRVAQIRRANIVGIPEPLTFYRRRFGQQTNNWHAMAEYWAKLQRKHRLPNVDGMDRLERWANLNMHRYFSYLAYEQEDFSTSLSLLCHAFGIDPLRFVSDIRNWKLGLACSSALILPRRIHDWLEMKRGIA